MSNSECNYYSETAVNDDTNTKILGKRDISAEINVETLCEVVQELGIIPLSWPNVSEPEFEGRTCFPESYYKNSNKEKLLLTYAENFRQQFDLKYLDRKPLLLQARNECGLQKMVCTTIRPTRIPYPELLEWRGCAALVADYLIYEPLAKPILALIKTEEELRETKYKVKPACDFSSKHLLQREEMRKKRLTEEQSRVQAEAMKLIEELEKPPSDNLHGWRVHSWVLVLAKSRFSNRNDVDLNEVEKYPFYIEPSSGFKYDIAHSEYLNVESVYNHENYYVNLANLKSPTNFVLTNPDYWERLLCEEPIELSEEAAENYVAEKHLDMPSSWVEKLDISISDFEQRYPSGKKTIQYKKAILEKHAPYSRSDGLIKKLVEYEDYDYTIPLNWYEWYEHRSDYLMKRLFDQTTNFVTEVFKRGREDYLKLHQYEINDNTDTLKTNRIIEFFQESHPDNLLKVVTSPSSITEYYNDRSDRLCLREIKYDVNSGGGLQSVLETFERNTNISALEDVCEKHFIINESKVKLVYHYGDNSFLKSTKTFNIPYVTDMGEFLKYNPDSIQIYEVNSDAKTLNELELYELLCKCRDDMLKTETHVVKFENKLKSYLANRLEELDSPSLSVPLFNTERNEKAKDSLNKKETQEKQMFEREMSESGMWPGTPYLVQDGIDTLNESAKLSCIEDFKKMQIARQNRLQETYQMYVSQLKEEKIWYLSNKYFLTPEMETKYFENSNELLFKIEAIESQLGRQQNLSASRYENLMALLENKD
ncbi:coiled-coil domain-containing protein lost boys isoform X2 [Arctopsyche grandis]|uniref:coiled-coil domain-containing protein lost boys isoform X2 n=1 Tax=Arctopsyche grandis TaxID=121162 RepID=UPI00406D7F38